MKNLLLLLVMVAMAVSATAQIEQLEPNEVKGDAMLGTSGGMMWSSEHVTIFKPEKGSVQITLMKSDHIFIKNYQTKIGFYTKTDSLVGMATVMSPTPSQGGTKMDIGVAFAKDSLPYSVYSENDYYVKKSWRVKTSDVLRWIEETEGYIRIVTPVYDNHLFDVRFRLRKD